jgi:hypothetical protein
MSSITTISSGMEESLDVEEFVDTRLSLSLVIGAGSRPAPPVQALLPASPPPGNEATAAARKRKGLESGRDGSTATTGQHGKKARRVLRGSCVDDDGGVAADSGARKKLQLTADQAAVMEKSFRAHNVLSHVRP